MFELFILLIAGIGAGILTGLIGASAVMIVAPLLIVFLDYPAYMAIGIALSIDVFASLAASIIYKKHNKIKFKPSVILLISALIAVLIASYLSKDIPSNNLGLLSGIGTVLAGFFILLKQKKHFKSFNKFKFLNKFKNITLIIIGLIIGTIAGIFGGGGGIMILLALVLILDYKTHEAIGTSVLLMIFIALFGGLIHYFNQPFPLYALFVGIIGGVIGAIFSSKLANKLKDATLSKVIGIFIIIMGILLILKNIIY